MSEQQNIVVPEGGFLVSSIDHAIILNSVQIAFRNQQQLEHKFADEGDFVGFKAAKESQKDLNYVLLALQTADATSKATGQPAGLTALPPHYIAIILSTIIAWKNFAQTAADNPPPEAKPEDVAMLKELLARAPIFARNLAAFLRQQSPESVAEMELVHARNMSDPDRFLPGWSEDPEGQASFLEFFGILTGNEGQPAGSFALN